MLGHPKGLQVNLVEVERRVYSCLIPFQRKMDWTSLGSAVEAHKLRINVDLARMEALKRSIAPPVYT